MDYAVNAIHNSKKFLKIQYRGAICGYLKIILFIIKANNFVKERFMFIELVGNKLMIDLSRMADCGYSFEIGKNNISYGDGEKRFERNNRKDFLELNMLNESNMPELKITLKGFITTEYDVCEQIRELIKENSRHFNRNII